MSNHPSHPGWTASDWTHRRLTEAGATEIGVSGGYRFFEDPELGEDAPLLAIIAAQPWAAIVWRTCDFELPEMEG